MAIFEQKHLKKDIIDDTHSLSCTIINAQLTQGHIDYTLRVLRSKFEDKVWHVTKRYSDFDSLYNALQISGLKFQFPPKKYFGNLNPEFVAERQVGLQSFLDTVLMNPILSLSLPVRRFLNPETYSIPFQEQAMTKVSMILRGERDYEIVKPLDDIGWRIRKQYVHIRNRNSSISKQDFILAWIEFGPDKYLTDKELQSSLKCLMDLQHPFIEPTLLAVCNESGGLVIRRYNPPGSLRDILYGSSPNQPFLKKYCNPKERKPLPPNTVANYATQILHALKFLRDKKLPFGHLHTSNILVENNRVKLTDIENSLFGVSNYYRPYISQLRKVNTMEAVDVYCFAHTLYEMSTGSPLQQSTCDELPANCPSMFRPVLELILSSEACRKTGLPTLDYLLDHPLFSHNSFIPVTEPKPHFKVSSHLKEAFRKLSLQIEKRLGEEQKKIRYQKKLYLMQEQLIVEENNRQKEKKKQRSKKHSESIANGKSERCSSPNSVATSAGTVTPPSGASSSHFTPPSASDLASSLSTPPPPPPPPFQSNGNSRSELLNSICNFKKSELKKTKPT
ncbi:unnamed protein product [Bemisia tabaci]|uniref:PX domain-containing protein kinase-like protein n=1 Tax=Bemisia tabaci TaxID=7038 RepID=A0A9P0EVN0_BEMTA|nr:unnamed protein product [Bemisia tabaci]